MWTYIYEFIKAGMLKFCNDVQIELLEVKLSLEENKGYTYKC